MLTAGSKIGKLVVVGIKQGNHPIFCYKEKAVGINEEDKYFLFAPRSDFGDGYKHIPIEIDTKNQKMRTTEMIITAIESAIKKIGGTMDLGDDKSPP